MRDPVGTLGEKNAMRRSSLSNTTVDDRPGLREQKACLVVRGIDGRFDKVVIVDAKKHSTVASRGGVFVQEAVDQFKVAIPKYRRR